MMRYLVALYLAVPALSLAATINPIDAKLDVCGRYEVYHVNGVSTPFFDAVRNLTALSTAYGNAQDGHLINYFVAHNRTQGFVGDVQQAWLQIIATYPSLTWEMISSILNGKVPTGVTQQQLAYIQQRFAALSFKVPDAASADTQYILQQIRYYYRAGSKVLFVSHSQGTLFTNVLYDVLASGSWSGFRIPGNAMNIVAAGNVTRGPRGGASSHVTNTGDILVNTVRMFADPLIRGGNVTVPFTLDDVIGHNFISIYLKPGAPAVTAIKTAMNTGMTAAVGQANPANLPYGGSSLIDYRINGGAGFVDCTPPQGTVYMLCAGWTVPTVTYSVAHLGGQRRAGSASELPALANGHANGCFDAAGLAWSYHRAGSGRATYSIAGCGVSSELSVIYSVMRSADSLKRTETSYSSGRQAGHGVTISGVCSTGV